MAPIKSQRLCNTNRSHVHVAYFVGFVRIMSTLLQENISSIVKSVFLRLSYNYVKPCQMEAILAFVSGRDVFVSLPTGYGKSICYASLPFVFDTIRGKDSSVIIVISPLNALI